MRLETLRTWSDKNKISELIFGIRNLLKKPDDGYCFEETRAYNAFMCDLDHYKKKAIQWTTKHAWDPEWPDELKVDLEIDEKMAEILGRK